MRVCVEFGDCLRLACTRYSRPFPRSCKMEGQPWLPRRVDSTTAWAPRRRRPRCECGRARRHPDPGLPICETRRRVHRRACRMTGQRVCLGVLPIPLGVTSQAVRRGVRRIPARIAFSISRQTLDRIAGPVVCQAAVPTVLQIPSRVIWTAARRIAYRMTRPGVHHVTGGTG